MVEFHLTGEALWARMNRAVEKVQERLERTARTLEAAGIPYAIIGGNAVRAWVAQADEAAVQNPEMQAPTTETPEEQAKQACEQARKDLRVIQRSTRIRLKQADGTTRFMTKEEIDQRRQSSEQDIEQFCK